MSKLVASNLTQLEAGFRKIWDQYDRDTRDKWQTDHSKPKIKGAIKQVNSVLRYIYGNGFLAVELDTSKSSFTNGCFGLDPDEAIPMVLSALKSAGIIHEIVDNKTLMNNTAPIQGLVVIDLDDDNSRNLLHPRLSNVGGHLKFPFLRVILPDNADSIEKLKKANAELLVIRATALLKNSFKAAKELADRVLGAPDAETAMKSVLNRLVLQAYPTASNVIDA